MSALDNYAENKRVFIEGLEERGTQLGGAARNSKIPGARHWLQVAADATNELTLFLKSPVFDQVIETFHKSPSERAKAAAMDLCAYFADAGLECSPNVSCQLHDNNWCVDAQVSFNPNGETITVSAHYDSDTGFDTGVC